MLCRLGGEALALVASHVECWLVNGQRAVFLLSVFLCASLHRHLNIAASCVTNGKPFDEPMKLIDHITSWLRVGGAILFTAWAGLVSAQPSQQSLEMAQTIPIADMHMHTYRFKGPAPQAFLEQMDKNGIVWGGAVGDYREDVASLLGEIGRAHV